MSSISLARPHSAQFEKNETLIPPPPCAAVSYIQALGTSIPATVVTGEALGPKFPSVSAQKAANTLRRSRVTPPLPETSFPAPPQLLARNLLRRATATAAFRFGLYKGIDHGNPRASKVDV